MLLLATFWHLAERGRAVLLAAAGLVAVAMALLTVQQEADGKDDLTVFTVAHQIPPHNLPVDRSLLSAHVQVALGLEEAGRCEQAMPIFDDAIRQYPQDRYAWAGQASVASSWTSCPKPRSPSVARLSYLTRPG